MIDRLMGYYVGHKFKDQDDTYQPSMAVQSSKLTNKDGTYLTVLFPPWRGGDRAYSILAKRLAKQGSAVLDYRFHNQILESDVQRVIGSFEYIQATVTGDIKKLTGEHQYQGVHLVASSLGNVSLAMAAKVLPDFTSATMVVAGSNLARCVWEGDRTQPMRQALEDQGIDEAVLEETWNDLAPVSAASSFAGKSVRMFVSTTDRIIPTLYQHEMAEAVSQYAEHTDIRSSRLGHIASVANYCLLN